MRKVLFDSSFLMSVSESPTGWEDAMAEAIGPYEPVLLDCVRDELAELSKGQERRAKLARVALQLASGFSHESSGSAAVDDELVSAALESGAAVATVDNELAATLRAVHVEVVGLRSGRVALR